MPTDFSFPVSSSADLSFLNSGTYIVLFHATRIPPHLLIFHDGRIWDLSVRGTNRGLELSYLLTFIEKKKTVCLCCEWKTGISSNKLVKTLNTVFARYDKAEAGKASCLFPIRDAVSILHGEEFQTARFIFELLPGMRDKGLLGKSTLLNAALPADGNFEILRYNEQQLNEAIKLADSKVPKD